MVFIFIFGVNRFPTVALIHITPIQLQTFLQRAHTHVPLKIQQHFTVNLCSNKRENIKNRKITLWMFIARTTENYIYVWMLHAICHEPIIKNYIKKVFYMDTEKSAQHIDWWDTMQTMLKFTIEIWKICSNSSFLNWNPAKLQSFLVKFNHFWRKINEFITQNYEKMLIRLTFTT